MGFVDETHAFLLEKLYLAVGASESEGLRDAAILLDYAVAGDDAGFRVDVKRVAHDPGETLIADGFRNLAVGGDGSAGDGLYGLVDLVECCHSNSEVSVQSSE